MKIEIFDDCKDKQPEQEPLRLRLAPSSAEPGAVCVESVRKTGRVGFKLLRINQDGTITLLTQGQAGKAYFKTDSNNRIKIDNRC